jgi:hypothetical protein
MSRSTVRFATYPRTERHSSQCVSWNCKTGANRALAKSICLVLPSGKRWPTAIRCDLGPESSMQ